MKRAGVVICVLLAMLGAAYWWFLIPSWVPAPALAGELREYSIEWQGRTRHYAAYIPSQIAAAPELVFVLHGSRSSGAEMRAITAYGFETLAERDGDVVVYPDGYEKHWNDCRRAGPYAANLENVDDVGFLKAVADALAASLDLHWEQVFATGLSNGGHMALRLALEAPEWVAAVAPIAAAMPVDENFDCTKSGQPVSFLLMNGTDDPMNPYGGGEVALYGMIGSRGAVHSSAQTVEYFATLAGYAEAMSDERYDPDPDDGTSVHIRWWQGRQRPHIGLIAIIGGGHTVPHPENRLPRILGRTSRDIDATEFIWRFFKTVYPSH